MEKRKLGEILWFYRSKQQVSQEKLCSGLCSVPTMSRIEQGEVDTPMLLAQALLERLGLDVSQFELLLDAADYNYFDQRQKVEHALQQRGIVQAEQELAYYEKMMVQDKLNFQFVKFQQAKIAILKRKSLQNQEFLGERELLHEKIEQKGQAEQDFLAEQAERLLQEAEAYTIPNAEEVLLSRIEIDILMTKVRKDSLENLRRVQDYVRKFYSVVLREKIYPAVQLKIAKLLTEQGRLQEALAEITEGIEVIAEGRSYQHCAELHFLYAQVLREQWEGKKEWEKVRGACIKHCQQAYDLYEFDGDERKEEVKAWEYTVQGM